MEHCKCSKEKEIAIIQTEIAAIKSSQAGFSAKLSTMDKLYKLIYEQSNSISLLAQQMTLTTLDVKDIKKDMEVIKSKDGDRYNDTVSNVIKTFLTLIIGYLFSKLF